MMSSFVKFKIFSALILLSVSSLFSFENSFIKILQSDLEKEVEFNHKVKKAAQLGFFYLEIPDDCKQFIEEAANFSNSFNQIQTIKNFEFEGFSGYHDRDESQVEALYLERKYWKRLLPENLFSLALKTHYLGMEILHKTLLICDVVETNHDKISGNVAGGSGDIFFTFNHYQSEKPYEGLAKHRDFGQFTILFADLPGLEVMIEDRWLALDPITGYFVVFFGKALENSINDSKKLIAAWHRVRKLETDRISFAICAGNSGDSNVYRMENEDLIDTGVSYLKVLQESKRYNSK